MTVSGRTSIYKSLWVKEIAKKEKNLMGGSKETIFNSI
jgi:hypothetical protein